MSKITLLIGLPASGKSTFAKEIVNNIGGTVRLNKDLLRTMLHYDKFTGRNESLTEQAEKVLAKSFLDSNVNVVVDDTNLNQRTSNGWRDFASVNGYKFEIAKVETPMWECVKRDYERGIKGERAVGRDVIINMARHYGLYPREKKDVICDIDGTLCDISDRLHFVKSSADKDWKAFFANIPNDKPRLDIIGEVRELNKEYNIVLVSGRPDNYKEETLAWLKKHMVPYETIIMRHGGDKRPDDIVKKEILDAYFDKKEVHKVIDDRPRVLRVWREEFKDYPNVEIQDVGSGIEF